jgi:RecJ-like exonuclease
MTIIAFSNSGERTRPRVQISAPRRNSLQSPRSRGRDRQHARRVRSPERPKREMDLTPDFFQQTSKVFTVAELTRQIRGTLETKFGAVWVQGEISNYRPQPSGHRYFTLKDQRAAISCVIFRNTLPPDAPPVADGAQVQVYGNVTVFEARGQYQLNVQILQTRGAGLLQAKFEALKRKLEAEGLFDPGRKRDASALSPHRAGRRFVTCSMCCAAARRTWRS